MPLPIQTGKVTEALLRAFGVKGRYTPMLDETIVPVYVVQDPAPANPIRLFAAHAVDDNTSGGAGNFIHIRLYNPKDSGVIGVVNTIAIQMYEFGGAALLNPAFVQGSTTRNNDLPSGVVNQSVPRDTRLGSDPGSLVVVENVNAFAATSPTWAELFFPKGVSGSLVQHLQAQSNDPRQPIQVLEPGALLEVATRDATQMTDNTTMSVNFQWLEIPLTETGPIGGIPG